MNLGIWGHLYGVVTVVLMIVFVGIWYWAWRPRHRRTFDRLANMPLEDLTHHKPDAAAHGHAGRGQADVPDGRAPGEEVKQESKPESDR